MRIGEHAFAGVRAKRRALGIGDARVEGKRGFFGFERLLNSRGRVDAEYIVRIELQIGGERAELGGIRQAGEGVFHGNRRNV